MSGDSRKPAGRLKIEHGKNKSNRTLCCCCRCHCCIFNQYAYGGFPMSNKYVLLRRVGFLFSFLCNYHSFTYISLLGHRPRLFDVDYLMSHLFPHGEQNVYTVAYQITHLCEMWRLLDMALCHALDLLLHCDCSESKLPK